MKSFSISDAFSFGFATFKKNFLLLLGVLFLPTLVNFGLQLVSSGITAGIKAFGKNPPQAVSFLGALILLVIAIVSFVLQMVMSVGSQKIYLTFAKGGAPRIGDIFRSHGVFWKYLGTIFLMGVLVLLGTLLFIIPGILLSLVFMFSVYAVLDTHVGPIDALKKSAAITHGVRMKLFVFSLASIGLNLLGFLCLIIGALVTIPVTLVAHAYVYETLRKQTEEEAGQLLMNNG